MQIIITKRNYNVLIGFIILISVFLFFRFHYQNLFISIEQEVDKIYDTYFNINDKVSSKLIESKTYPLYDKTRDLEWQFGFIIIFFTIISFLILVGKYKSLKDNFLLFLTFAFLDWSIFAITQSREDCDTLLNVYKNDNYFVSLLFLCPFLYFIYKETIIGQKIDITEDIKNKAHINHEDSLKDLNKLLEMDLISQEEYNEKKELRTKEKTRTEIKDTEEYNLLLKSKEKGLLTEQEFKTKVENLVSKKSQIK